MTLKQRVERLGFNRILVQDAEGLNNILPHEDWVAILDAKDPVAELLRRCPNYYQLEATLKAAKPDPQGVRRIRI